MTDLTVYTGDYTLDPAHSTLGFVARHAMITKVRGSFADFTGTAHIDGADISASKVSVTAKVASFSTGNKERDAHVTGAEFLDAEQHPELTFVSTAVTPTGETSADVTGDLTIRGTTKSVTIPFEFTGAAKDPFGNERLGFEGATEVLRSEWGLTWNAALETGGVLVSDKIRLELEISAIRN